jgi:N-methylhydantoinase B
MTLDPVDYAVVSQALLAAAREMGTKLVRSAYSNIVREARDASAAILDPQGSIVAQSEMVPMQLGSMNTTLRACLAQYLAATLTEDDFLVNNHPFHGGQHLQDVFIFRPVFVDGELIAFAGSTAHHLDLGGGSAGLNALASDVYQEGLLLPPLKFSLARDWNGGNFERLLAANIRVPDQTLGDFNAQFAAKAIGIERVRSLCAKYGVAAVKATMTELQDYAERQLRAAIRALPDGVYRGSDAGDDIEGSGAQLWVHAKVTVAGDTLEIDLEGTCAQVARNINSPIASTESAVMSCIKGVLIGNDVPFNEGSFRPVTIKVPYGSILNPRPPAPVRARMLPCYRAYDAVMKALAQVAPERAIASGFDNALITCLARLSNGRYRVCLETYGGGFGASAHGDGADGIAAPLSNTTNSPIEALDMEFDYFRIAGYALNPDSFGHGANRGGLGMPRTYEILKDDVDFSLYGDRFEIIPEGLRGGTAGALTTAELIRDGQRIAVDLKRGTRLKKGDLVIVSTSGGAGFGDPRTRAAERVAADVEQGVISGETARLVYGYAPASAAADPAPSRVQGAE